MSCFKICIALGSFNADQIILNDMLASIGTTEDQAFLLGTGTQASPKGIVNWAAAANVFDATQAGATATLTEVQTDLRKAEQALLNADVPILAPVWIMSHRSRLFLRDIRDQDDRGVYKEELSASPPTLNGYRVFTTNNLPNNLGSGEDESLVILVDAAQVLIGDVAQLVVDRSDSATLKIDGVDTNLFTHGMSALRAIRFNDLAVRHAEAVSVIEAVKWGA